MRPAFQSANVPGESRQEATGRANVQLCAAWLRSEDLEVFLVKLKCLAGIS